MQEHTPGPWVADADGHILMSEQAGILLSEVGMENRWTAVGTEDPDGFSAVVALAHPCNARLIAAAPDLLAACLEFVRKVDAGEARSVRSYAEMKTAIAKATRI